MKTRFFLTIIAAVFMATSVSAQNKYLESLEPLSYTEFDGHVAAIFDMDEDGEADAMFIDVDDSNDLTGEDLIMNLEDASFLTVAELMEDDEDEHFYNSERVLSYDEIDGHEAANVDLDDDGEVDVTIVDADDSHDLSEADVVIDYSDGSVYTIGELVSEDNDEED